MPDPNRPAESDSRRPDGLHRQGSCPDAAQNPSPKPAATATRKLLIAGFGNVLRGDDGFGVEVVRALGRRLSPPPQVKLLEIGIGGITLVQELMDDYQAVIIVDALAREVQPGRLSWASLEVGDCRRLGLNQRTSLLADIHYANPNRALVLARALDLLPPSVYLLGCEVDPENAFGTGLSQAVSKAVPQACGRLEEAIRGFLANHREAGAHSELERK